MGGRCTATPTDLTAVFSAQFAPFVNTDGGRSVVAAAPLVVPSSIAADVVFVSGLTELPWTPTRPAVVFPQFTEGSEQEVVVVPDSIR